MRFHYLDWGTRGRPPMVFLHGGGLNVHTWDLVCAALKPERHCIALDQRGHGDSEWSPSDTLCLQPENHPNQFTSLFVDMIEHRTVQLEQANKMTSEDRLLDGPCSRHAVMDTRE